MLETFRQLRENYHGSPSFIKQHEENIIETAHETLALFHKPPEPEQLECQSNISYTSVGNMADFDDFDRIQSYDDNDDVISQYSIISDIDNSDDDDLDEALSGPVDRDTCPQNFSIKNFGMSIPSSNPFWWKH